MRLVRRLEGDHARTPRSRRSRGFDSVVLIAGGRNKGLDLGGWPQSRRRMRAVVAIGEAAAEVAAAFARRSARSRPAGSMDEAVAAAPPLRPSPATPCCCRPRCASFDWYAATPSGATTSPAPCTS